MNLGQFLEHWSISENPFRAEEARHDAVFARMTGGHQAARRGTAFHSDFDKVLGELAKPTSAILFGEKGSGKTAIRLQIENHVRAHNAASPSARVLLVAYDDLNAVLDTFHRRVGGKTALESLRRFSLVDHVDAILSMVVPGVIDGVLGDSRAGRSDLSVELGPDAGRDARRWDTGARRDVLLLQAVYDRPDQADLRTRRLRRALRLRRPSLSLAWAAGAWLGWIPAAALAAWWQLGIPEESPLRTGLIAQTLIPFGVLALGAIWLAVLFKRVVWDRVALLRLARRLRRQVRITARSDVSFMRSLAELDRVALDAAHLPLGESDETRYAMLDRLRRALRRFGYAGMIVVMDRVDEPTLVNGDPEAMRAVVWPLLNNKFLQQEGLGVKLLLAIDLRHALFKESSAFFQEARLDKQSLVERLTWTGAMLYDLCDARLRACRPDDAEPMSLRDLFADDVSRQDLVDALDQMHQPRDAFKFLYACLNEHCSNVTAEQEQWRIPRLVLETVRKQQSDRVQQLYRGIRPA